MGGAVQVWLRVSVGDEGAVHLGRGHIQFVLLRDTQQEVKSSHFLSLNTSTPITAQLLGPPTFCCASSSPFSLASECSDKAWGSDTSGSFPRRRARWAALRLQ